MVDHEAKQEKMEVDHKVKQGFLKNKFCRLVWGR